MNHPIVPQVVQSCHELLFWLIPQLDKFSRARRFTLGERIEMRSSRLRKTPPFTRFDELTAGFDRSVLGEGEELRATG